MIFQTTGILLKRKPFREYDEIVTFFTLKHGKVDLVSYGSKSIKSRRKYFLSRFFWLDILIEQKDDSFILRELNLAKHSSLCEEDYLKIDPRTTFLLEELIKKSTSIFPYHLPGVSNFFLLEFLTNKFILQLPYDYKKIVYFFSLLLEWNFYEELTKCRSCNSLCSEFYYYFFEAKEVVNAKRKRNGNETNERNQSSQHQFLGMNCLKGGKKISSSYTIPGITKGITSSIRLSLREVFYYNKFIAAYKKFFPIIKEEKLDEEITYFKREIFDEALKVVQDFQKHFDNNLEKEAEALQAGKPIMNPSTKPSSGALVGGSFAVGLNQIMRFLVKSYLYNNKVNS